MSAAVITKILMKAQERAQGQGHSRTFHCLSRDSPIMIHEWFVRKIQKEKKANVGMDETKIDVTFVILKVRNPQFGRSVDQVVPASVANPLG